MGVELTDCPWCKRPRTPTTCACRGCVELTPHCDCDEASEDLLAHEGLCAGCRGAGCLERLAAFERCTRLAPQPAPPTNTDPTMGAL